MNTSNLYLDAVKSFCAWLVQDRRTADNPLAHLEGGNVKLDRRHDRQTLSEPQLAATLGAARNSPRAFRGLTGLDRHALYLCAMGTGEGSSPTRTRTWNKPVNSRLHDGRNSNPANTSGEASPSVARQLPGATEKTPTDPDLAHILDAWSGLPEPIRRAILALVESGWPVDASGRPVE